MSSTAENSSARLTGIILFLASLLTLSIYISHAGNYFFHDSVASIENNRAIRISGLHFDEWRTAALSTETGILGRPISMLSFAANHVLSGEITGRDVRITNIVVHVALGIFLWLFLKTVLSGSPILGWDSRRATAVATLATALWLLHPLHVSTVLYTVQRMTQLAALFTAVGLWWLFNLRCTWLLRAPQFADYSKAALVLCVFTGLGAFSKESGLLLPLFVAVTELCLFRFRIAGGTSPLVRTTTISLLLIPAVGTLGLVLLEPQWLLQLYANRDFSPGERVLTQLRLLWQYIGWIALPDISSMGFHHDDFAVSRSLLNPVSSLLSVLAWSASLYLAWRLRGSLPLLAFSLLWFLCGHVMESSVMPLEMVYEHRNYMPSVGLLVVIASLLLTPRAAYQGYARFASVLILATLTFMLTLRCITWSDEKSLAEYNFRNHPESVKTTFQLAASYFDTGQAATDREQRQQFVAASRQLLLQTLDLDKDYVPALALLIYLDSHSSDGSMIPTWYSRLGAALDRTSLHVSDVKFIAFLNECVMQRVCPQPTQGQEAMLRELQARYPNRLHLQYQLALYCYWNGDYDCARQELNALIAREPGFFPALELIYASYEKEGNSGQAQETVRRLLLADKRRRLPGQLLRQSRVNP